jgi:hypothetical protein
MKERKEQGRRKKRKKGIGPDGRSDNNIKKARLFRKKQAGGVSRISDRGAMHPSMWARAALIILPKKPKVLK